MRNALEIAREMVAEAAADCGLTEDEVAGDMADAVILELEGEGHDADDVADAVTFACGTPRYEVLKRIERMAAARRAAAERIEKARLAALVRPEVAAANAARRAERLAELRKDR